MNADNNQAPEAPVLSPKDAVIIAHDQRMRAARRLRQEIQDAYIQFLRIINRNVANARAQNAGTNNRPAPAA